MPNRSDIQKPNGQKSNSRKKSQRSLQTKQSARASLHENVYSTHAKAAELFEIFLVAIPGFEAALAAEARDIGFQNVAVVAGGVTFSGGWPEIWRANLYLRGASAVFVRLASFPVFHLAQLDKRARKVPWDKFLRSDRPFRVDASCKHSKIYHSGAAKQRVEAAITDVLKTLPSVDAVVCVKARIEDDICTISIDTSGEGLHKRGYKEAVNAAPMRETMAALFLRLAGYDGSFPVLDPMCGSGTFIVEAAEIAAGLLPGRARSFAFDQLATFQLGVWDQIRNESKAAATPGFRCYGSDRDAGAIKIATANAVRAEVEELTAFRHCTVSAATAPSESKGLVIVNPPYGKRMGDKKRLVELYKSFGKTMINRFSGWRVAVITNDISLAAACELPFRSPLGPFAHGGQRIYLFLTEPLP